jgi:flagellar hook-basal body complex protein FliE
MDPISAMRLTAAGRITPFNPPVLDELQTGKIPTDEIKKLGNISTPALPQFQGAQPGRAFSDLLGEMVHDVNAKQASAARTVDGLVSGENVPLHQAMIAVEEASVSFQLMVEVRNKLLESYQELMRMQV